MKKESIKKLTLGKKAVAVLKKNEQRNIKGGGNEACPTLTVCPDGCPTTITTVNA
jgi:natural product precursor